VPPTPGVYVPCVTVGPQSQAFSSPAFDLATLALTGNIHYRLDDVNFTDGTTQIAYSLKVSFDHGVSWTEKDSGTWTGGPQGARPRSTGYVAGPGMPVPTNSRLDCVPNATVNVGLSQDLS
jgi:hypothetical protein